MFETDNGVVILTDEQIANARIGGIETHSQPTDHCATCACQTCKPHAEIKGGHLVAHGVFEIG